MLPRRTERKQDERTQSSKTLAFALACPPHQGLRPAAAPLLTAGAALAAFGMHASNCFAT